MAWRRITGDGTAPSARGGHSMNLISLTPPTPANNSNSKEESEGGAAAAVVEEPQQQIVGEQLSFIVVFGGADRTQKAFNDVFFFDLQNMSWRKPKVCGTPPSARSGHSGVTYDGKLWVFGGQDTVAQRVHGDLHTLDVKLGGGGITATWSPLSPTGACAMPRGSHCAVVVDRRMIVACGANEEQPLFHPQVLDLDTLVWSEVLTHTAHLPGREMTTMTAVGQRLFVVCGRTEGGVATETIVLDAGTLEIIGGDVCPHPRAGHSAACVDGQLIIFGGTDLTAPPAFDDTLTLNTATTTWTRTDMHSSGGVAERFAHGCCVHGSSVFVFGGVNFERDLRDLCVLDTGSLPVEVE